VRRRRRRSSGGYEEALRGELGDRHPVTAGDPHPDPLRGVLHHLDLGSGAKAGAIEKALLPLRGEAQRQVVVITDGYIGFESEVIGNILGGQRVELRTGARVTGDIEAPIVVVDEGVTFDGNCRMTKAEHDHAVVALSARG